MRHKKQPRMPLSLTKGKAQDNSIDPQIRLMRPAPETCTPSPRLVCKVKSYICLSERINIICSQHATEEVNYQARFWLVPKSRHISLLACRSCPLKDSCLLSSPIRHAHLAKRNPNSLACLVIPEPSRPGWAGYELVALSARWRT